MNNAIGHNKIVDTGVLECRVVTFEVVNTDILIVDKIGMISHSGKRQLKRVDW